MISVVACRRLWVLPVRRKASVHLWKSVRDRISNELLAFFFSQNCTEEQKSQRRTETLSQPITQNDITKISRKVLWYLSSLAGVCGFSLFAERLLFICENLWEIESPTSFLRSKICEKKFNELPPKNLPHDTNHGARGKKRKLNYRCIVIDITSMPSRWKHN